MMELSCETTGSMLKPVMNDVVHRKDVGGITAMVSEAPTRLSGKSDSVLRFRKESA
jgi:hypothetical protein